MCNLSKSITNRFTHEMYHLGLQIVTATILRVLFFQPHPCELLDSWLLQRVVFPLFYKELVTVDLAVITQIKPKLSSCKTVQERCRGIVNCVD